MSDSWLQTFHRGPERAVAHLTDSGNGATSTMGVGSRQVGGMAQRGGTTAERGLDAYAASAGSLLAALLRRPGADLPLQATRRHSEPCDEGTAAGRWPSCGT